MFILYKRTAKKELLPIGVFQDLVYLNYWFDKLKDQMDAMSNGKFRCLMFWADEQCHIGVIDPASKYSKYHDDKEIMHNVGLIRALSTYYYCVRQIDWLDQDDYMYVS